MIKSSTSNITPSDQTHADTSDTMRVALEVFGIVELVENIFAHLDIISFLRAQQVNRFCKAVFDGSTALKRSLGLFSGLEKPVGFGNRSNATFNPLINSRYIAPWFHLSVCARTHMMMVDDFTTSVLQAAQSPASGLYHISATIPPVMSLRIDLPAYWDVNYTKTITKPNGVSVGDIVAVWLEVAPLREEGRPFCVELERF